MADDVVYEWRGRIADPELNRLHAEGFDHPVIDIRWTRQLGDHSLGWVTARQDEDLIGFVNVAWDGGVHAFLLDTLVAETRRHRGIGTRLVEVATRGAAEAGCEWLHVDWDDELDRFYLDACGFESTPAGLIQLRA